MNLIGQRNDHKAQCEFLNTVKHRIDDYGSENLIIGGDLNTYLNIYKDTNKKSLIKKTIPHYKGIILSD